MAILLLADVIKLKEIVQTYGYAVHVHDACGGQSFTLEPVRENPSEQVYQVIEDFFIEHQMAVNFYDAKKLNFVAK